MARINFEERIFKHQGFQDLMIDVRSRHMAKGVVVELFQLAQEFWFPNQLPIPMDRFEAAGLPAVLFAPGGLCEKRDGGVYVRGSKDAFAWLFEKAEAGKAGGLKSAEVRKKKFGSAQPGAKPRKRRSSPEAAPKQRSNDFEAPEASLLSSLSSSLSTQTLNSNSSSLNSSSPVVIARAAEESAGVPKEKQLNLSERVSPQTERELLSLLPQHTLKNWTELYPDAEYLNRELLKAFAYYRLNSKKCPQNRRGWATALSSWFERGWPKHVARIPGQRPDDAKLADWIKAGTQRPSEFQLAIGQGV